MKKSDAIKLIVEFCHGGLPRAVEIYKYLSCYGEIVVTREMIVNYFNWE